MANRLKPICAGTLPLPHPKIFPQKLNAGLKNWSNIRINNNNRNRTNRRLVLGFGVVCSSWSQFMNMFGLQKGNSFLASAKQTSAVEEVQFSLILLLCFLISFIFVNGFMLILQFMLILDLIQNLACYLLLCGFCLFWVNFVFGVKEPQRQ